MLCYYLTLEYLLDIMSIFILLYMYDDFCSVCIVILQIANTPSSCRFMLKLVAPLGTFTFSEFVLTVKDLCDDGICTVTVPVVTGIVMNNRSFNMVSLYVPISFTP